MPQQLRSARRVLQAGAVLVVLAAVGSPLFDLDRFQVPKELVLHAAAFGAAWLALRQARRIQLGLVDLLLLCYGVATLLSALLATNHWLGFRAAGMTWAGLAIFWSARALARAGMARPLLGMLAFAAVLGALTALLQAYGADLPLESERRSPGGTLGNRNFMAHLTALALPLVVFLTVDSRARIAPLLGGVAASLSAGALLLSRSRAAWLAVAAGLTFLVIEGILVSGLSRDQRIRSRLAVLAGTAALGMLAALALPNALRWRSEHPYLESLLGVANYREGSGRGRLVQYENTMHMAADHPLLGVGPGNWPVVYPRYTTPDDPAWDADDPMPTNPWPSSDWMALLAERGAPALVFLWAAGSVMIYVGWRRSRERANATEGLAGLTLVATATVAVVVGTFDAVLLLAAPAFFTWALFGALLPPQRQLLVITDARTLRALTIAVALAGTLLVLRSASQLAGIMLAGDGRAPAALRWAARIDPGNYGLRLHLASSARGRERCAVVREHAAAALELFPEHPAPRRLLRSCGVRTEQPRR